MRISGALAALSLLALAGCGGGSSGPQASPQPEINTRTAPPATTTSAASAAPSGRGGSGSPRRTTDPGALAEEKIEVSIPGLTGEHQIPPRYTCDGADISLPLHWTSVPAGTAELALLLANLRPVHKHNFFDWAVAGIDPALHGFAAGRLPPGAIVGRNSFGHVGYSICPPKGNGEEHFIVRLMAIPHPLHVKAGFDAETLLHKTETASKVFGLAGGIYTRR